MEMNNTRKITSPSLSGGVSISPSHELLEVLKESLGALRQQELLPVFDQLVKGEEVTLGIDELRWISENLSSIPNLGKLLLSSSLQLPKMTIPERNPELEKRCEKLRKEQEEREYCKMTNNVRGDNTKAKGEEPIKKQMEEVNRFLLLILQFVVSVVCAFMFGYMGPYILYGRQDVGGRILLGIVLGFVVGCADMYFVIRQLLEEDGIKLKKID